MMEFNATEPSYLGLNLDEIGHLKIVIQEKDEKISELYVTLESKDKEMDVLKAQIKQLEGEKILEARSQESQLADVPKDVAELKEAKGNLERKDLVFEEEIKDLKEEIKDLNEQIKDLNDQIKKLKAEKQELHVKLRSLERKHEDLGRKHEYLGRKHEDLEKKHVALQTEVAKLEGNNLCLEDNVGSLTNKMNGMKEKFQTKNRNLKKEVGELKCDLQKFSDENKQLIQLKSNDKEPFLILGELCSQTLSLMYKKVLPTGYHDERRSYQVEDIEKDIEALENEESKSSAEKKWAELKETLNWKDKHSTVIRSIKQTRNIAGHAFINEELLCKAAKEEQDKGNLYGWKSYKNVIELIGMWKKLHEMH